jgi:hypothetical protein
VAKAWAQKVVPEAIPVSGAVIGVVVVPEIGEGVAVTDVAPTQLLSVSDVE